jgi:hypothetical protein
LVADAAEVIDEALEFDGEDGTPRRAFVVVGVGSEVAKRAEACDERLKRDVVAGIDECGGEVAQAAVGGFEVVKQGVGRGFRMRDGGGVTRIEVSGFVG